MSLNIKFSLAGVSLVLAAALSACQSSNQATDRNDDNSVTALAVSASHYLNVTLADEQYQLMTDASQLRVQKADKLIARQSGKFSRVAIQALGPDDALLAAIESDSNSLMLWHLMPSSAQPLVLLQRQVVHSRVVEDICFYHSSENQQLSLFLLGGRGGADQLLLQQQQQWLAQPIVIRELNVPYDSTACAVDHHSGSLYIAEADRAIWRYQAEPEADEGRSLVQVNQPFGQLQGEVKALAVLPDSNVLALEEEPARLLHLSKEGKVLSSTVLGALEEAGNLSVSQQQTTLQAYVSSETGAAVQQVPFTLDTALLQHSKPAMAQVQPTVQTEAASQRGDVIDDPAVWHHPAVASQSLILATDKRAGLDVYTMQGKRVQQLAVGRLNNVDVRYGLSWRGKSHDIAAASSRDDNSLQLFAIDASGKLHDAGKVNTGLTDIYGLCMYQNTTDKKVFVFVNDKSGVIEQYQIDANGADWQGRLVRSLKVPTQPEGCVADDISAELFVGEEDAGIWRFAANAAAGSEGEKIILVDGERLVDDVEGLALAQSGDKRYLVVSSQGNDSYVLYDAAAPYSEQLRFRITTNPVLGIDGTSETDGLEVTTRSLGPGFEQGALIVQDGRNRMPEQGQNLKLVPWQYILQQLR
ncbi:phytase [Rheinheimera aquimaris]|uniref:Phytase n=1 Tax=Rheinheimera aquimaris TaxID=412437 RepID=A0ABN1E2N0_9GAMM|nr:phytase [Rheinheimera aquimaris]MCB5214706.1 phytase [Rheinheimera aquimaris]